MRVVSAFTGVGGFDLGLERAGHEVIGQVELDDYRSSVLRRHWPGVPMVGDVREVRSGSFDRPDLVCAGFPCRDLSVAGLRRGIEAEASEDGSGLFFELCRVADDLLGPGGWLLLENVPGLLSAGGGRDFAVLLRTLGDLGFHDVAWRVLDGRHFGVPQSRRRVFILARRSPGRAAREVLLEPAAGGGDSPPGGEAGPVSPEPGDSGADPDSGAGVETILGRDYAHALRGEGFDASEDGTGRGTPIVIEAFAVRGRGDGAGVEVMPDGIAPALRSATGGASRSVMILDGDRARYLGGLLVSRVPGC